jgi:hypothetical protein
MTAAAELDGWANRLEAAAEPLHPNAKAIKAAITQIVDQTRALAQDLRNP